MALGEGDHYLACLWVAHSLCVCAIECVYDSVHFVCRHPPRCWCFVCGVPYQVGAYQQPKAKGAEEGATVHSSLKVAWKDTTPLSSLRLMVT